MSLSLINEVNMLKTEKALKSEVLTVETVLECLNGNMSNHIGLFTNNQHLDDFLDIVNYDIDNRETYQDIINKFIDMDNKKDFYYVYDFNNNEINIFNINDKDNGLILTVLNNVSILNNKQSKNYYNEISNYIFYL